MRQRGSIGFLLVVLVLLSACNATKFVPQDKYLLNKTKVVVTDTKDVSASSLRTYLRQKQNTEVLGFWKLQLHVYNTAPVDTTTKSKKRLARNAHKLGEAPEIYDDALTQASMKQLRRAMNNLGYFDCKVDTQKVIKKRKVNLTFLVTAGRPYYLRNVEYSLPQEELKSIAKDEKHTLLHPGNLFDANVLDEERKRVIHEMRTRGYYYIDASMLCFVADSTRESHGIDVEMRLKEYVDSLPDSSYHRVFSKYQIRNVCFHQDYDPKYAPDSSQLHTSENHAYQFTWVGNQLLREKALCQNCAIRPGDMYNERMVERTYEWLNQLGIVKYVDISFAEVAPGELDCHVVMARSKLNSFSAQVEGTYSSGDWGVSAGVGYVNRNIFHGAEELQVGASGSYEWRQNGGRAIEGKVDAALSFPFRLKVSTGFQYQTRPDEFTRMIVSGSLGYKLRSNHNQWNHTFQCPDISYVYLPWISEEFRQRFITKDNPLKYSYESHFIMAMSYSGQYSGFRRNQPLRSYGQARFFVETAGNVLYGIARAANLEKDDGVYKVGNVAFSQYTKMDVSGTYMHIINEKHRMVYHAALGVAIPYGNSEAVPYEKRYFAGGSNHVRGWTARSLGPGGYKGEGSRIDYDSQTGDIHLDLSVEYRWKVWSIIELAAFTDAGNIWTIRDYEAQKNGAFHWDSFYKEIAWSYGVGLRLDITILIFRLDLGVKLYDPTHLYEGDGQKVWRTAGNGLSWNNDMTLHFAIGYPF